MGFLSSFAKAFVHVALTPVEITKDMITLGGSLTEEDETYTMKRLRKAQECVDNALEDGDSK